MIDIFEAALNTLRTGESVALATIVGLIVMAQAYLVPWMVPTY